MTTDTVTFAKPVTPRRRPIRAAAVAVGRGIGRAVTGWMSRPRNAAAVVIETASLGAGVLAAWDGFGRPAGLAALCVAGLALSWMVSGNEA